MSRSKTSLTLSLWLCWHPPRPWLGIVGTTFGPIGIATIAGWSRSSIPIGLASGTYFETEIAKGWQLQCLLGDPHFEPDSSQLSPAGIGEAAHNLHRKIPCNSAMCIVERGANDELTTKRLIATQRAVASMIHSPGTEVLVSEMPLIGSPAEQVNGVNSWLTGLQKSYPAPQTKAFHRMSTPAAADRRAARKRIPAWAIASSLQFAGNIVKTSLDRTFGFSCERRR